MYILLLPKMLKNKHVRVCYGLYVMLINMTTLLRLASPQMKTIANQSESCRCLTHNHL